jgi:hypothetical protein
LKCPRSHPRSSAASLPALPTYTLSFTHPDASSRSREQYFHILGGLRLRTRERRLRGHPVRRPPPVGRSRGRLSVVGLGWRARLSAVRLDRLPRRLAAHLAGSARPRPRGVSANWLRHESPREQGDPRGRGHWWGYASRISLMTQTSTQSPVPPPPERVLLRQSSSGGWDTVSPSSSISGGRPTA